MSENREQHPLAVAALQARAVAAREPLARAAGTASDPWLAGELARVIACQDLRPDDRRDAMAILDGLRRAGTITPGHQGLHAQLALAGGDRELTRALLAEYAELPDPVRTALTLDLRGDDWAAGFAALFPGPPVRVADGTGDPIDRLVTGGAQRIGHPRRISTVVTPGEQTAVLTAVRSLVAQTWTNHEILVVDDGSRAGGEPALRAAAALDPRVRVLRVNARGPYAARNAGLDAATGDFVTFQDAGDWSHPLRLERQIAPLLDDDAVLATTSAALRVTPDLLLSRPGVEQIRAYSRSSLMIRRAAALGRVGYFDPILAEADAEYVERVRAVLGRAAVRHLGAEPLALVRLSGPATPVGWTPPARRSYRSAFRAWHERIRDGRAHPLDTGGCAVPRRLRGETGARAYDVILAGDWTVAGAAGSAGTGQLRALAARGQRAALLQLDAPANLRHGPLDLDPAVQALINDGTLTQVEPTDDVRARLVVVRSAAVLEHAPDLPAGVRAQRVVIEAPRVSPAAAAAARRLFGRKPLWAPAGPDGRRLLGTAPDTELTDVDLPGTVDAAHWRLDRRGPRSDRPVAGRHCRGGPAEWRRLRSELPDPAAVDVRLLDGAGSVASAFASPGPPGSWLVYGPGDVSLRSFLYQVDFYLHLPEADAPADPDPDVLTALAAGCVVVLPRRYRAVFGDAAVYCDPPELAATLGSLHGDRQALRDQSARGPAYVRRHHGHELYAERVARLATRG